MPTYSYACSACAHRFDAVQSIHADALTECPECGDEVRRVISAVGVSFKGSGFYRTDSRAAAKSSGKGSKSGSTSSPAAPSSTTSAPSPSKDSSSSAPAKPASTSAAAGPS